MSVEIKMPKLGMTMTKGKIVRWIKEEGDNVAADEPIFAVANDKVTIDVESPAAGVLLKRVADEGDIIPVGDIVAYLGEAGEHIPEAEKNTKAEVLDKTEEKIMKQETDTNKEEQESTAGLRATPAARALAKKLGIKLTEVKAYYKKSRIKKADVEMFNNVPRDVKKYEDEEAPYVDIIPSNIRLVGAERMTENFTNVPHFYLCMKVDVSKMQSMLENAKSQAAELGEKPTFTDVLAWIISRVIKEFPIINSQWNDGKIRQFRDVNFGIATDTPDGLVVPVIQKADSKTFAEIVKERTRVINAARKGALMPDDMSNGTFTLSNLGMFGIKVFQAILNSPECALLTVGAVEDTLSLEYGEVKSVPMIEMSLTCDHRVLDGATGAKFLNRLKEVMEEPAKLLDKNLF